MSKFFLHIKQTCSTVAFVNPIIKGSKNSERFRISPEVTNLKNITTIQQNWSGNLVKGKMDEGFCASKVTHHNQILTDLDS